MRRARKWASSISWFGPHQTRSSLPGSRTTNLSFGARPVWAPVETTMAPPRASSPSPAADRVLVERGHREVPPHGPRGLDAVRVEPDPAAPRRCRLVNRHLSPPASRPPGPAPRGVGSASRRAPGRASRPGAQEESLPGRAPSPHANPPPQAASPAALHPSSHAFPTRGVDHADGHQPGGRQRHHREPGQHQVVESGGRERRRPRPRRRAAPPRCVTRGAASCSDSAPDQRFVRIEPVKPTATNR